MGKILLLISVIVYGFVGLAMGRKYDDEGKNELRNALIGAACGMILGALSFFMFLFIFKVIKFIFTSGAWIIILAIWVGYTVLSKITDDSEE